MLSPVSGLNESKAGFLFPFYKEYEMHTCYKKFMVLFIIYYLCKVHIRHNL